MNVLLTGSSGNIGREIGRQLSVAGHQVIGLDQAKGPFTSQIGSITDRKLVDALCSQADALIHTAALHAPHVITHSKEDFIEINIKGTLNLLEASARHRLTHFVMTSSTSIYGNAMIPSGQAVWVTERLQPQPRDIYDISKQAAENLCADFARDYDLRVTCLRTSRFWNEPIHLRTFYRLYRALDVRDAARAHLLALAKEVPQFGIYNISAQSPFQQEDLGELLLDTPSIIEKRAAGFLTYFKEKGWALPGTIDRVYVIDKAKAALGYEPQFNFGEMIRGL